MLAEKKRSAQNDVMTAFCCFSAGRVGALLVSFGEKVLVP